MRTNPVAYKTWNGNNSLNNSSLSLNSFTPFTSYHATSSINPLASTIVNQSPNLSFHQSSFINFDYSKIPDYPCIGFGVADAGYEIVGDISRTFSHVCNKHILK